MDSMNDADDDWSAEPDDSFRTPKLDFASTFDSLKTPTALNQIRQEEEPTPQQESYRPEYSAKRDSQSSEVAGDGPSGLARALPRLKLEEAIDADPETRHAPQQVNNNGNGWHDDEEDNGPATARPDFSSRASSFSQASPDLHVLASMYKPDEAQLTVADSAGYFENISLSTPTIERFVHEDTSVQWGGTDTTRRKGKGKSIESSGWPSDQRATAENAGEPNPRHRMAQGRQYSSGRGFSHRKTASDASHNVIEPGMTAAGSSRRASWMSNAAAFASTPSFTHEPDTYHPESDLENYRPRASSSASSIADSVGTAGEAPDSDYEDARSKSHSRQGSRRPSVSEVPIITKRLSSFAPLPSLKASSSQTDLSRPSTEGGLVTSADQRKPERQDTDSTIRGETLNRTDSSQSAASTASGSSTNGPQSAPTSRTNSAGATTYSVPMTVTNSQSFEQHRKENESWIKKRKKTRPSPLDKVISKTRPRDLPPKEREEDVSTDSGKTGSHSCSDPQTLCPRKNTSKNMRR